MDHNINLTTEQLFCLVMALTTSTPQNVLRPLRMRDFESGRTVLIDRLQADPAYIDLFEGE